MMVVSHSSDSLASGPALEAGYVYTLSLSASEYLCIWLKILEFACWVTAEPTVGMLGENLKNLLRDTCHQEDFVWSCCI